MKKIISYIGISIILLSTCATTGQDKNKIVTLDEAIREGADHIESTLETGLKVALLNFSSPSEAFSAYMLDELSERFVNGRKLIVVDRAELELIRKEERFQLSGEVSDATAVSIGQKVGAQIIVSGSLAGIGQIYRVRIRVLDVETAIIAASRSSDINPREERVRALLAGKTPVAEAATQTTALPARTIASRTSAKDNLAAVDAYKRGITFRYRRDYEMAILEFTEAIRLKPNYAEAYYERGLTYYFTSRYNLAIPDLTQAISINPSNAEWYCSRGSTYSSIGQRDLAIADHTQALRINPDYAEAYTSRGIAYSGKGDHDRAIADYNRSLSIRPNHASTYAYRGTEYRRMGNFNRAISDLETSLRIDPNDSYARIQLDLAQRGISGQ